MQRERDQVPDNAEGSCGGWGGEAPECCLWWGQSETAFVWDTARARVGLTSVCRSALGVC